MLKIEENISLATMTTFRTGGLARYVVSPCSESEVIDAVLFANEKKLPLVPIGSGSNILAPDSGLQVVFVRVNIRSLVVSKFDDESVEVVVGAGREWDAFVQYAVRKGWWGIENLSAIPGTVGAAVVQNISAYGVALQESIVAVRAYDTKKKIMLSLSNEECLFGYRASIFKNKCDRFIVVSVTFCLKRRALPRLEYRDVTLYFSKRFRHPTLSAIRRAIVHIRKDKFPPLTTYGTAGSFFLNPVVSEREAKKMQALYSGMPLFLMPEGGVKVPLAWILDHELHLKGERCGGAFLWEKQALVITAKKGTRAADIVILMKRIQKKVFDKTKIKIIPEVRILSNKNIISKKLS
jgi:UDP-N-acetylmuramate dehydrogenase